MTISIEKYIALNNPREVAAILEAHGSRKIDKTNILDVVHRFTDKKGDFAFEELAKIDTPYRRLILSTIKEEKKSGCAGCGGTCGEKKSNCCGSGVDGEKVLLTTEKEVGVPVKETIIVEKPVPAPAVEKGLTQHSLMVAGVVLLGILTIAVVIRK